MEMKEEKKTNELIMIICNCEMKNGEKYFFILKQYDLHVDEMLYGQKQQLQ